MPGEDFFRTSFRLPIFLNGVFRKGVNRKLFLDEEEGTFSFPSFLRAGVLKAEGGVTVAAGVAVAATEGATMAAVAAGVDTEKLFGVFWTT